MKSNLFCSWLDDQMSSNRCARNYKTLRGQIRTKHESCNLQRKLANRIKNNNSMSQISHQKTWFTFDYVPARRHLDPGSTVLSAHLRCQETTTYVTENFEFSFTLKRKISRCVDIFFNKNPA